jgi:drug/metabolite transporter (DMT)-like permease
MYWFQIIIFTLFFCLATAGSIVLLGDRSLISGNLFSLKKLIIIALNWRFILAIFLAFAARISFILINNNLLKIPRLANNSTTATAFITTIAYLFVMAANWMFLDERFTPTQLVGCGIILLGICLVVK